MVVMSSLVMHIQELIEDRHVASVAPKAFQEPIVNRLVPAATDFDIHWQEKLKAKVSVPVL